MDSFQPPQFLTTYAPLFASAMTDRVTGIKGRTAGSDAKAIKEQTKKALVHAASIKASSSVSSEKCDDDCKITGDPKQTRTGDIDGDQPMENATGDTGACGPVAMAVVPFVSLDSHDKNFSSSTTADCEKGTIRKDPPADPGVVSNADLKIFIGDQLAQHGASALVVANAQTKKIDDFMSSISGKFENLQKKLDENHDQVNLNIANVQREVAEQIEQVQEDHKANVGKLQADIAALCFKVSDLETNASSAPAPVPPAARAWTSTPRVRASDAPPVFFQWTCPRCSR